MQDDRFATTAAGIAPAPAEVPDADRTGLPGGGIMSVRAGYVDASWVV